MLRIGVTTADRANVYLEDGTSVLGTKVYEIEVLQDGGLSIRGVNPINDVGPYLVVEPKVANQVIIRMRS